MVFLAFCAASGKLRLLTIEAIGFSTSVTLSHVLTVDQND